MHGDTEITNYDDIIDSRDVIARIEYLSEQADDPDTGLTQDEDTELTALVALARQGEEFKGWQCGATLIRDSHFARYAEELANDITENPLTDWPHTCINWEMAAHELQVDYSIIEFDGVDYWIL